MQQLAFPFRTENRFAPEDFLVSECNRDAHALVTLWPEAWATYGLVLTGPEGSGKTHLASLWADAAGAGFVRPAEIGPQLDPLKHIPHLRCVIDGVENVADQRTLLHLLNLTAEHRGHILLTSALPKSAWPFTLPDLTSRLNALPFAEIQLPDDSLLESLALKLFSDRQLVAPAEVLRYLVARGERSFRSVYHMVEAIDRAAMSQGRKISLPLARQALEIL